VGHLVELTPCSISREAHILLSQGHNEQDFIRRAAAWRIRSVELNRWIQAQAVGK
jgi:hypothetical protein